MPGARARTCFLPHMKTFGANSENSYSSLFCSGSFSLACHALDVFGLFRNVGSAVGAKHFVKPDSRFTVDIRTLPGIPRQMCLCFSLDQSPVDGGDVVAF